MTTKEKIKKIIIEHDAAIIDAPNDVDGRLLPFLTWQERVMEVTEATVTKLEKLLGKDVPVTGHADKPYAYWQPKSQEQRTLPDPNSDY